MSYRDTCVSRINGQRSGRLIYTNKTLHRSRVGQREREQMAKEEGGGGGRGGEGEIELSSENVRRVTR